MSNGDDLFFFEDRVDGKPLDLRLLRRLLSYLRPHRGLIALALLGLALGTACQLAGPYIIKILIDRHIVAGRMEGMPGWIVLYLGSLAGAMGFLYVQMLSVSVLGQKIILAIRKEMFARLARLPVSFFDRTPTGRLMTRLTSDVEALQELISSGLVSTVGDVTVLLGIAVILVWMDPWLAAVTFAVLPVLLLFVEGLKKFIREANREMRRKLARLNAFLQEHVSGVAVVKAFVQEGKAAVRFDERNDDYAFESIRLTNYYSLYFPGVELLSSVAVALILWQGGGKVISGAVTFGTLVAFLEYAQKFFNPIKDMSDKYNILQSALASCERIFHILDAEPSPEYAPSLPAREWKGGVDEAAGQSPPAAIEFRDVWFSYADDGRAPERVREPVLKGVSFCINEGESGAIVGATGAGKTTILSLLCRLYEIQRGRILLFGKDIREIPGDELRMRISLVLQDPFLFSGSVRENVEAGGPDVDAAVAASGVAGFAGGWDEGLSTAVGERGGKLSVGERQLVAFARALARRPDVLLLDEATSSVDPVIEDEIRKALANILSGRTSLVVAHRLSTVLSADRIIVLHKGRVRETGTHRELMEAGGIYRRLYTLQFEGETA